MPNLIPAFMNTASFNLLYNNCIIRSIPSPTATGLLHNCRNCTNMFSTRGDLKMKNSASNEIAQKIAQLTEGKNVSWIFENGKIFLRFKIDLADINYDYILMAAFEYKKMIVSSGHSEYAIVFECEENNLESVFHDAETIREKIIKEAKNISNYENSYELRNDIRFRKDR